MDVIEPSEYDVIVASSGLVECLLASALVRAGKSVLLLDQTDVYGAAHASFTLAGLHGSTDASVNPHARTQQTALDPAAVDLPGGLRLVPWQPRSTTDDLAGRLHHVTSWYAPDEEAQKTNRGYILDLAPKVMYQAEPLVDVLVHMRAHNYLEFKSVDNSLIYRNGTLTAIPASRAHIFKDKGLSLAEKRTLMTFLTHCLEAAEGRGPLTEAMSGSDAQSMHTLLQKQGLSPYVRDIIMYGIAMCPVAPCHTPSEPANAVPGSTTGTAPGREEPATVRDKPVGLGGMTAAQGLAALQRYAESLGRFGASGAFMAPSYGCGSIPEALVRHCAVKGAVTALRQPLEGVLIGPPLTAQDSTSADHAQTGASTQEGSSEQEVATVARGVLLASGQALTCNEALVLSGEACRQLRGLEQGAAPSPSPSPATEWVARCVAVLDRALTSDHTMATVVIPPETPGVGNAHPVYGMVLSPATATAPPGRYLLYLSTVALGVSTPPPTVPAQSQLEPALRALATLGEAGTDDSTGASSAKPRVQQAHFYWSRGFDEPGAEASWPARLVACPGASPGMHGYATEVQQAQALMARHFPGVLWLLDDARPGDGEAEGVEGQPGPQADGVEGGAGDEDDEAIDELEAALNSLAGLAALPVVVVENTANPAGEAGVVSVPDLGTGSDQPAATSDASTV